MAENEGVTPEQDSPIETTESSEVDEGKGGKEAVLADLARERAERKKLQKDLDSLRKQSMSDAEKAVAEAEERGKALGRSEGNQRVVRSEFVAAAARRNADFDVAKALEFVDTAKFLDEHGEIDSKALTAAVAQLVPEPGAPRPRGDVGQGPRPATGDQFDGNNFLRSLAGR